MIVALLLVGVLCMTTGLCLGMWYGWRMGITREPVHHDLHLSPITMEERDR